LGQVELNRCAGSQGRCAILFRTLSLSIPCYDNSLLSARDSYVGVPPFRNQGKGIIANVLLCALDFSRSGRGSVKVGSKLSAFLKNNSEVLEKLAIEMYARGLSSRDIEDALLEATGEKIL